MNIKTELPRSRGAVTLAHAGVSGDELAAKLGVSTTLVSFWIRGHKIPSLKWRTALNKLYNIRPRWWYEACDEKNPSPDVVESLRVKFPPRKEESKVETKAGSTVDDATTLAQDLIKTARQFMADINASALITPLEKARLLGQASSAAAKAARITGEGADIPVAKLMRTPAWSRLARVIVATLEPWPDAMRALAEALKKVSEL